MSKRRATELTRADLTRITPRTRGRVSDALDHPFAIDGHVDLALRSFELAQMAMLEPKNLGRLPIQMPESRSEAPVTQLFAACITHIRMACEGWCEHDRRVTGMTPGLDAGEHTRQPHAIPLRALQFANHWRERARRLAEQILRGNAAHQHLGQVREFQEHIDVEESAFADFAYDRLSDDELDDRSRGEAIDAALVRLRDEAIHHPSEAVRSLIERLLVAQAQALRRSTRSQAVQRR